MNTLVRYLFQLLSYLPFSFFHGLSSVAAFLLEKVIRYRRPLIEQNIRQAFPDASQAEIDRIVKAFYRNFTDTFTESIKLLSLSSARVAKRCTTDLSLLADLVKKGKSVQLMGAHQFNWEYANQVIPPLLSGPYYFVYRTIASPAFNNLFLYLRTKRNALPVAAEAFSTVKDTIFSRPAVLILGADQNPSQPAKAIWMNFFGKPTPFHVGPAKGAITHNTAMVMLNLKRKQRGYYHLTCSLITEEAASYTQEELTWLYKKEAERVIKEDPTNYLWSHRRWRHSWNPSYGALYEGK